MMNRCKCLSWHSLWRQPAWHGKKKTQDLKPSANYSILWTCFCCFSYYAYFYCENLKGHFSFFLYPYSVAMVSATSRSSVNINWLNEASGLCSALLKAGLSVTQLDEVFPSLEKSGECLSLLCFLALDPLGGLSLSALPLSHSVCHKPSWVLHCGPQIPLPTGGWAGGWWMELP